MKPMHSSPRTLPWFRIGTVVTLTLVASAAFASQNGIVGRSGKQGQSCNTCHNGGVAPTVALTGPLTLDAGAKGIYTFTITTNNVATGMNAAATDGVLAANVAGGNVQVQELDGVDEVTHTAPMDVTDAGGGQGTSTYRFELTAPAFRGPITLFAAGNAVNKNGQTDGDQAARDQIVIMVNGPARPADAGPDANNPPPQPTNTAPPVPTTTVPPGPSSTSTPPGTDAGVARSGAKPTAEDDDGGCSIGWADRSSTPGGVMIGTLVALAAFGRARSRRRPAKK